MVRYLATLIIATLAATAQAQPAWSGRDVEAPQVRALGSVVLGTVLEVLPVRAYDRATDAQRGVGGALGALVGAAAAHREGGAAQAAAALVGGIAGEAITRRAATTTVTSQEVIIALDDGKLVSVVQSIDEYGVFQQGQPVYILGLRQAYDPFVKPAPIRVLPRQVAQAVTVK